MSTAMVAWAHVRITFYLLFAGMWRGECLWTTHDEHGKLLSISAGPPDHSLEHAIAQRGYGVDLVDALTAHHKVFYRAAR